MIPTEGGKEIMMKNHEQIIKDAKRLLKKKRLNPSDAPILKHATHNWEKETDLDERNRWIQIIKDILERHKKAED